MCFSASASLIAGVPLSALGAVTVNKVRKKSEIPFALFPFLFGLQQIIEGIVWFTFTYNQPLIHAMTTHAYALFAYVLWPILVPFAIRLLEPISWRKNVLSVLLMMGMGAGLYLLYCILRFPVTATIVHESIVYHFFNPFGGIAVYFYLTAVCLSCLVSSNKIIVVFGMILIASLVATYLFYSTYIVSIWCFFAAILSGIVYLYFAKRNTKGKNKKSVRLAGL